MRSFPAAFVTALIVSAILTPFARRLAFRLGAVSTPGGRHVNERAIPRLGGLAIFVALFAPLFALYFLPQAGVVAAFHEELPRVFGLFIGGTIMATVGFLDDTKGLRALTKLYAQIGVACLAFALGFRIEAVSLPLIGTISMGIFALPVTAFWIVGIINAVNLIDGLDGLAAGVVFFAALTNFILAWMSGATLVALVMASLLGAVLGFLFYNFNPARIFMGDSGSYLLGYVLATMSLVGAVQKASTAVSLLVPVVALGVPIIDTLFAIVRRFLERRPLFAPDRGHIHHRLLELGITHRRAVLIIYAVCVVFTVAALGIALGHDWELGLALMAASAVLVGLVRFVGYFEYLHIVRRQKARVRSRDTELLRRALPELPSRVEKASSEEELFRALEAFSQQSEVSYFEMREVGTSGQTEALFRFEHPEHPKGIERELVSACFPIGRDGLARYELVFGWLSDFGDAPPESEILLQVAVDLVETRLSALKSPYAPRITKDRPSPLPEPSMARLIARKS